MNICKNKKSGESFIYINEINDEEALFVTPDAKIKSLNLYLFDDLEEFDEATLLEQKIIDDEQLQRFHEYKKDRSDEFSENLMDYFETLSPYEKNNFIKQLQKIYNQNK